VGLRFAIVENAHNSGHDFRQLLHRCGLRLRRLLSVLETPALAVSIQITVQRDIEQESTMFKTFAWLTNSVKQTSSLLA
jgi:hypothetical protein